MSQVALLIIGNDTKVVTGSNNPCLITSTCFATHPLTPSTTTWSLAYDQNLSTTTILAKLKASKPLHEIITEVDTDKRF